MVIKTVYFLLLIMATVCARDFSFDLKLSYPVASPNQKQVSSDQKTVILGVTEFEYFNNLLKRSLSTKVWLSYAPSNLSYDLYIEDSLQGIDYVLLVELSQNQAADFVKNLQDYLATGLTSSPVTYSEIRMFFNYRGQWYQQKSNQFVFNKDVFSEDLQLIIKKFSGTSRRFDQAGKPYFLEETYDPSVFCISKQAAQQLVELMVSPNRQ